MEKSFFEQMGGTYHQEGDYFLPDLLPPESIPVGIWGQRRRHYLKTQRKPTYIALLLRSVLDRHLSEVDAQAEAMFFQLVKLLAEQEGITEQFKTDNQMEWVQRMNNIRNRAEENSLQQTNLHLIQKRVARHSCTMSCYLYSMPIGDILRLTAYHMSIGH